VPRREVLRGGGHGSTAVGRESVVLNKCAGRGGAEKNVNASAQSPALAVYFPFSWKSLAGMRCGVWRYSVWQTEINCSKAFDATIHSEKMTYFTIVSGKWLCQLWHVCKVGVLVHNVQVHFKDTVHYSIDVTFLCSLFNDTCSTTKTTELRMKGW
jgi:Na+-translocating ferredoxin:NAD+ oxidoreductase RnfD subunit